MSIYHVAAAQLMAGYNNVILPGALQCEGTIASFMLVSTYTQPWPKRRVLIRWNRGKQTWDVENADTSGNRFFEGKHQPSLEAALEDAVTRIAKGD